MHVQYALYMVFIVLQRIRKDKFHEFRENLFTINFSKVSIVPTEWVWYEKTYEIIETKIKYLIQSKVIRGK